LVDNASNIGKEVLLEGTLEPYFNKPGLKNARNYEWVGAAGSTLDLSTTSLSFVATGESKTFTITSNTAWTITPDAAAAWCTVTPPLTGSNNATVNVTAAANSGAQRTATITISGTGVTGDKTVAITQAGVSGGGGGSGSYSLANISLASLTTLTTLTTLYVDDSKGSKVERILASGETISTLSYTASSSSIWTGGWNNTGAAWVITSITATEEIYGTITVSFRAFGVAASPRKWLMRYSNDNTTWHDGATYEITVTATPGDEIKKTITIPEANKISAGGKLYIQLIPDPSSTTAVTNPTIGTSNVNSRLASLISVVKN
jgi:hypothetical protein